MLCPKCGKEFNNGSNTCPFCGANIVNVSTTANKPKKKKTGLIIGIIIGAIVLLLLSCCSLTFLIGLFADDENGSNFDSNGSSISSTEKSSNKNNNEGEGELSEEEINSKCLDILNSTPASESFPMGLKLGPVLNEVVTDYEITIKKAWGANNYDVTISGSNGEITYTINIENKTCEFKSDKNNIKGFVNKYVVDYYGYGAP